MDPHKQYLAAKVLNDGIPVSYRELSREFGIHVNEAKETLSSFYRYQSRMKPGSIHATYLLTGQRRTTVTVNAVNGNHVLNKEDEPMASSPFNQAVEEAEEEQEESVERVVLILGEEHLDSAKEGLEGGCSFHIYSIEPGVLNDFQILTECNLRVAQMSQDNPKSSPFGTIQNPEVKRREIKTQKINQDPLSGPSSQKPRLKKSENRATDSEDIPTASQASAASNKSSSRPTSATGRPVLKKENSNIFKSFAKAKPKLRKEESKDSAAKGDEEVPAEAVKFDSDESNEDDDDPIVAPSNKKQTKGNRNEVHENLKKMWDNDKEDESVDSSSDGDDEADEENDPMEEDSEPEADAKKPQKAPEPAAQETRVEVSGGRRRGKRIVMQSKTYRDEENFLHTKKVPVEESFSEDDVPPAPSRPKTLSQQSSSSNKPKTAAAKTGRADIASFFKKK